MEFKVTKRESPLIKRYSTDELDIARAFAKKVYKEFGSFIKTIALFGSAAKKTSSEKSDVDILVIVNDMTINLSSEVVETYRIIMEKLVPETSPRIHLTTLKFTNFWDMVRTGDPIAINILRDGVAIIDTGFFDPLQSLLYSGRIRPTYEAIWTYYTRAPTTLQNSQWHLLQATVDLYWAVIDSAHAALMKVGEIPPSPEHAADLLQKSLVKKKLISQKYVTTMRKFYDLSKKIIRREISKISGSEYDKHYKEAQDFVQTMRAVIEKKG